mmetsp:Transcript_99602/g.149156  ORF Transcript_99602/g.149156 Transcript_99602/m.149156 type:complete len:167 (+) Transcript_99602:215-715(+)|eukprot:CAMPEP_0117035802 /NCGR_PEP_ID=MMETSP0472-20121206/25405_1 /TAXON_ID=693140 ORGANISM="Tiarina fusus, Strain LIS" /NCGR_SAMPLE_ID=MMETSP0472 /ASSEMBLY_ACC=CAM_ASM_000603 /LENGTH=166 /DNA_ID=CAMNT_0004745381 /DNA_START=202 /DNA_END=702 /DNA_ORIENTATION=-
MVNEVKTGEKLEKKIGPPVPPTISTLFNCAGISHESIKKLSAVDGEEFASSDASEFVTAHQLPFREKLILKELQIMFEENRVPLDIADHEGDCALCSASTPTKVRYFLEEHNKVFDFDLLDKFEITGRLFLALTGQDVRNYFGESPIAAKQLISTISYAKKQHFKN